MEDTTLCETTFSGFNKDLYKSVCIMILFILKSYLKPHQKNIQDSSELLKLKIMWQENRNFKVVRKRKCESSFSLSRVVCVCKGIRPVL